MFRLIKLILLLLVTLSFAACRKDEPTVPQRRLKNCYVEYLNFYGDVKYYHYTQFFFYRMMLMQRFRLIIPAMRLKEPTEAFC